MPGAGNDLHLCVCQHLGVFPAGQALPEVPVAVDDENRSIHTPELVAVIMPSAQAWVYYERYSAANQTAELLAEVAETLGLAEADADSELIKAQEARDGGVAEVQRAVAELQTAHGKVGRHWTIVAQEAGAIYLLYLFGYDNYLDEAIEAYRSALKGREDADYTERLAARLARLEKR